MMLVAHYDPLWLLNVAKCIRHGTPPHRHSRAVGRSENPGVPVLFGGHNLPPFVELGLTDLPKSASAMAPPATPGTTGRAVTYSAWNTHCRTFFTFYKL